MLSAKILIVDDEADLVQAFKRRFEDAGFQALTAGSATEALDLLQRRHVDVILADFLMPGLDGIEMIRRIRDTPRLLGVKVLLFSCHEDQSARRIALRSGALDYLPKSMGASRIVSRVRDALDHRAASREMAGSARTRIAAERAVADTLRALSAASQPPARNKPARGVRSRSLRPDLAADLARLATALRSRH
jgi:two-component system alkaline phosphatase synthesis response regulator PhoP